MTCLYPCKFFLNTSFAHLSDLVVVTTLSILHFEKWHGGLFVGISKEKQTGQLLNCKVDQPEAAEIRHTAIDGLVCTEGASVFFLFFFLPSPPASLTTWFQLWVSPCQHGPFSASQCPGLSLMQNLQGCSKIKNFKKSSFTAHLYRTAG